MHQMVFMEENQQSKQYPKNPITISKGFITKNTSTILLTIILHWTTLKTMSIPILIITAVTMATETAMFE
jgi:hypothetical protein